MQNTNTELFERMPVPKALASLAVPTIISQLIVMIYNLADTFFIGQTNDPYKIAAVSMSYVLFFMLNAFANLFGIGGGSLISRLLGRKQPEDARSVCAMSFYGTIAVTVIYCAICFFFMEPILYFMGASENTIGFTCDYTLWVIVVGGIPASVSMAFSHLLRSEGHGKQASFGLSMGGILNIILDPIFMFVLFPDGQEVAGAAAATALSNYIALIYYVSVFFKIRDRSILTLSPRYIRDGLHYLGETLAVGFPSALSNVLSCIAIMIMNSLAAGHGDIAVAAIGIVMKIQMLPLNTGMGICQGMIPLISYNYAAGNYDRMKSTIRFARISGLVFICVCILVFEIAAVPISYLFIRDPETVALTAVVLRILSLSTPLMFCNFHIIFSIQAMGKGKESLILSLCRQGVLYIPLLFIMDRAFGVNGINWAQFVADGLTLFISAFIFHRLMKNIESGRNSSAEAEI